MYDVCSKIDAFTEEWPESSYGPGHIVLDDLNLLDANLDWCIGLIQAILTRRHGKEIGPGDMALFKLKSSDLEFLESMDWYDDDTTECLGPTLGFLQELRAMPEDDR